MHLKHIGFRLYIAYLLNRYFLAVLSCTGQQITNGNNVATTPIGMKSIAKCNEGFVFFRMNLLNHSTVAWRGYGRHRSTSAFNVKQIGITLSVYFGGGVRPQLSRCWFVRNSFCSYVHADVLKDSSAKILICRKVCAKNDAVPKYFVQLVSYDMWLRSAGL